MTHASTRTASRWLTAGLVGAATLAFGISDAQADDNIIAPGTRPMWGALALGPAIGAVNFPTTQFKLEEEFGYHFSGDSSGPAIGANIGESFAGAGNFVGFQPGAKFWWDIQLLDDMAIYLSPNAKVGYAGFYGGGGALHNFNFEVAAEGKVILADRGLVFFRPIGLDFFVGDGNGLDSFIMRYDMMFGGGVIF